MGFVKSGSLNEDQEEFISKIASILYKLGYKKEYTEIQKIEKSNEVIKDIIKQYDNTIKDIKQKISNKYGVKEQIKEKQKEYSEIKSKRREKEEERVMNFRKEVERIKELKNIDPKRALAEAKELEEKAEYDLSRLMAKTQQKPEASKLVSKSAEKKKKDNKKNKPK
jgi:hypothetical protein